MSPIIACAVLLTGASSLRLAPTMVLQPRRDLLAGGAAAAASTLLVPEAIAKKPLCLPGTNPASALGGPGYTIGILEHDTPSFKAWHKVIEGIGSDLLSVYPPECKVIDEFFIKTTAGKPNGQDAVLAGLVFETSGLKAVKKFFDNGKSPIFEQGRKDGWLTGTWRENYFASAVASEPTHAVAATRDAQVLRLPRARARPAAPVPKRVGHQRARGVRPTPSTPSTRRLAGFGAHALGVSYQDWLQAFGSPDIDALHESMNIQYSVCGPVNGKVSTDLDGGVGVLHVHKSFKDTQRFDAAFQDVKAKITADGIFKEPSRFVRCPRPRHRAVASTAWRPRDRLATPSPRPRRRRSTARS